MYNTLKGNFRFNMGKYVVAVAVCKDKEIS